MPEFQYQGVDRAGKKVTGKLNCPTEGDLRMALRGQGIRPVRITKAGGGGGSGQMMFGGGAGGSVPLEVLVAFTRQLNVLITSGIPIVQGLEILYEQSTNRTMKAIVGQMKEKVAQGSYFWESIAAFPKAFPRIYVALIRAGETSGSVDQMLKRLSRYLEDANRLRKMVKGAMMYPSIVVLVGIGVIAMMLTFVIPKFEELLKNSGQELPLPTQIVLDMSHFMTGNIVYITGGLIAFFVLGFRFVKSTEGKAIIDRALFRAPLFGNIMVKAGTARFSRTMQTLLASGVNLIDAVEICKATVDNAVIEAAVGKIRAEIEAGKTFGMVITKLKVFPDMAVQMITVGESTGNLDQMLDKVADFYEEEVENLVAGLTKMIEPLILVLLGGSVGGLLIAMYLPIFKLAGAAG
jgi:type IV pilus assembly protein PilC